MVECKILKHCVYLRLFVWFENRSSQPGAADLPRRPGCINQGAQLQDIITVTLKASRGPLVLRPELGVSVRESAW